MATGEDPPTPVSSTASTYDVPQKTLSCALCAHRKVKCDKQSPCSNCQKAGVHCVVGVPIYHRRRKRRALGERDNLLARLKRYERLLLNYGAKIEDLDGNADVEKPLRSGELRSLAIGDPPNTDWKHLIRPWGSVGKNLDCNLWVSLSDEILENSSDDDLGYATTQDIYGDESSILLGTRIATLDLTSLHPSPVQIFQLWQTFMDNVNPLVKLFHTPTVQQRILVASGNLSDVPKPMEALMFSIYALAVNSINEAACESLMGETRSNLLARYHTATQQALIAVNLLMSADIVVLQAFMLFLLSIRHFYDLQALFVLTGVALRIAQRLGLHREKQLAKMSAFDAEMGRRLWWQIIILEARTAELVGGAATSGLGLWDTLIPRNLNDGDLDPGMRELPAEHTGTTEMVFCLVRYQIGDFLRRSQALNGSWALLTGPEIPLADKQSIVTQLEDTIEQRFLQYLDPVIPLHFLSIGVGKSITDRMRLMCLHPRQYPESVQIPQSHKDELFAICVRIVGRDNWAHTSNGLSNYLWHINFQFQSDAFVYVLNELRFQCTGSKPDSVWQQCLEVFKHHPDMLTDMKKPLYVAIGNLTLKSWAAREAAYAKNGQRPPEGNTPHAIMVLRFQRMKYVSHSLSDKPGPALGPPAHAGQNFHGVDETSPFDPSPVVPNSGMDTSPIDWMYWDDLIKGSELEIPELGEHEVFYPA